MVNRSWAPLGADRFFATINAGFYNQSAFFRVAPGFVVQFGISGSKVREGITSLTSPRPTPTLNLVHAARQTENEKWLHSEIPDDPVKMSNTPGTLVYADAGKNTRSTQLFINYGNNARLDAMGFSPFAKVVGSSGMQVATKIFNPTPGQSMGKATCGHSPAHAVGICL